MLSEFFIGAGFKPFNSDSSVFAKGFMYITAYIDDLLFIGLDIIDIEIIKAQFSGCFSMTNLGPIAYYFGMKVIQD